MALSPAGAATSTAATRVPAGFVRVGPAAAVPMGLSELQLRPGVRLVLVKREGGVVSALGGDCPHKQAQMAVGDIEETGGGACSLICPRHRKRFDGGLHFDSATGRAFLRAGTTSSDFDPTWRLPVYNALECAGDLFVSAEPRPDPASVLAAASGTLVEEAGPAPAARSAWSIQTKAALHGAVLLVFLRRQDDAIPTLWDDTNGPWHVSLSLSRDGVSRDYTPVSSLAEFRDGRCTLLVRIYSSGALTKPLSALPLGATVFLSPPQRTLEAHEMRARFEAAEGADETLLLVGGGSGVTPILQFLQWVVSDTAPCFRRVLVLLSARDGELMREEVAALARRHAGVVSVLFTRTGPAAASPPVRLADAETPASVRFAEGRVSAHHLRTLLEGARGPLRVLVSGPPGFAESVAGALREADADGQISVVDSVALES